MRSLQYKRKRNLENIVLEEPYIKAVKSFRIALEGVAMT